MPRSNVEQELRKHHLILKAGAVIVVALSLLLSVVYPQVKKSLTTVKSLQKSKEELELLSKRVVVLGSLDGEVLAERTKILWTIRRLTGNIQPPVSTFGILIRQR